MFKIFGAVTTAVVDSADVVSVALSSTKDAALIMKVNTSGALSTAVCESIGEHKANLKEHSVTEAQYKQAMLDLLAST